VQREALGENERLIAESRRLRTAMRLALDSLDDASPESGAETPSEDGQNTWPGAREAA
jgi:hypothetical protein